MLRTWKLAAILAVAIPAFATAQAAEPADQSAVILKKLDEVQKALDAKLSMIHQDQLSDRKQLEDVGKELSQLRAQVGKLRQDLDALRSQSTTRVAKSPANVTGRIRLVNVYPEQMTVLVNQTAYRLAPGEVRTLESQPAGAFLYQVLGAQFAPQSRLLAANETFTITVYPR